MRHANRHGAIAHTVEPSTTSRPIGASRGIVVTAPASLSIETSPPAAGEATTIEPFTTLTSCAIGRPLNGGTVQVCTARSAPVSMSTSMAIGAASSTATTRSPETANGPSLSGRGKASTLRTVSALPAASYEFLRGRSGRVGCRNRGPRPRDSAMLRRERRIDDSSTVSTGPERRSTSSPTTSTTDGHRRRCAARSTVPARRDRSRPRPGRRNGAAALGRCLQRLLDRCLDRVFVSTAGHCLLDGAPARRTGARTAHRSARPTTPSRSTSRSASDRSPSSGRTSSANGWTTTPTTEAAGRARRRTRRTLPT